MLTMIFLWPQNLLVHHMQVFDTGGEEEKLDMLEPGKGKGVDDLDRVVVDHLENFQFFR